MSWAQREQAPGQLQGASAQPGPVIGEFGPRQVRAQSPGGTRWSVVGLLALEAQHKRDSNPETEACQQDLPPQSALAWVSGPRTWVVTSQDPDMGSGRCQCGEMEARLGEGTRRGKFSTECGSWTISSPGRLEAKLAEPPVY